jgi:hypothetical protein
LGASEREIALVSVNLSSIVEEIERQKEGKAMDQTPHVA